MATDVELLDGVDERVKAHRTTEVELCITMRDGRPLADAQVDVALERHAFALGANAFNAVGIDDEGLLRDYRARFSDLLDYATLPFYWGGYEKEPGQRDEARLDQLATWCADAGIVCKGHPLVWHEVFPKWAATLGDDEVIERAERRVREIVSRFAGRIDIWDVVNEATVSHRFDNAIARRIVRDGAASFVERALGWAREANPGATLLYNDFNVSSDYEALARELCSQRTVDVLGVQSHMHIGPWSLEHVWDVCDTYAAFGRPLHFTELTVLSGRPKAADDKEWHRVHTDWHSTVDGEAAQAEYAARLYAVLFSHPAVQAVTWWDFSDYRSWQGAPSGLVRADMTPKPLYEALKRLFEKRWTTRSRVVTDASGRVRLSCFHGRYSARIGARSGAGSVAVFEVRPSTECVAIVVA
jgi:GH35 family endo-1,4-beta-xylanase